MTSYDVNFSQRPIHFADVCKMSANSPRVITYQKAYEQTILTRGHACQCEFWLSGSDHFNIEIKYILAESQKFHTNREKIENVTVSSKMLKLPSYLDTNSIMTT